MSWRVGPLIAGLVFLGMALPAWAIEPIAQLLPDDWPDGGVGFGRSIAMDGDVIVVGSPSDNWPDHPAGNTLSAGAFYVFRRAGTTWTQEVKRYVDSPSDYEYFGTDVALKGDYLLVTAERDAFWFPLPGIVYSFRYVGGTWIQQGTLTPSISLDQDGFGLGMAMDGDRAVVGAPGNGKDAPIGRAFVFRWDGASWVEEGMLTVPSGTVPDGFAGFVAISGTTVVVGARGDDEPLSGSGSAFVYSFDGANWNFSQKLTPANPTTNAYFGSVAIHQGVLLVGASGYRFGPGPLQVGSVFEFQQIAGDWTEVGRLDEIALGGSFGAPLAFDGSTLIVGTPNNDGIPNRAPGGEVFDRVGNGWVHRTTLDSADLSSNSSFGAGIELSSPWAVVSRWPVYVFCVAAEAPCIPTLDGWGLLFLGVGLLWIGRNILRRRISMHVILLPLTLASTVEAQTIQPVAQLLPDDWPEGGLGFGHSIAMDGDVIAVGSYGDTWSEPPNDVGGAGAVYVFRRTGGIWTQEAKLFASSPTQSEGVGWCVAMKGDSLLAAAAPPAPGWSFPGRVYVFRRTNGTWQQSGELTPSISYDLDRFGIALAMDSQRAVVGALGLGPIGGQAFVFRRDGATWIEEAVFSDPAWIAGNDYASSVTIHSDTVLVGSPWDDEPLSDSGSVFVYHHDGSNWVFQAKLTGAGANPGANFGTAVAVHEGVVLVGAPGYRFGAGQFQFGSVFEFQEVAGDWTQMARLDEIALGGTFGSSIAFDGSTLIVGTPNNDGIPNRAPGGEVFDRVGSQWVYRGSLVAADPSQNGDFGRNISVSAPWAVVSTWPVHVFCVAEGAPCIPTLGGWGLLFLGVGLLGIGRNILRRRISMHVVLLPLALVSPALGGGGIDWTRLTDLIDSTPSTAKCWDRTPIPVSRGVTPPRANPSNWSSNAARKR